MNSTVRVSTSKAASSQLNYRALAEFRYQIRRFVRASEDAAREAGIEPQHHQLLLALKGATDDTRPTVAWLAERLQLNHNSTVGLIDRLVARGLVSRRRDTDDQRRVLIDITSQGETILRELSLFHQQELRQQAPVMISAIAAIVRSSSRK